MLPGIPLCEARRLWQRSPWPYRARIHAREGFVPKWPPTAVPCPKNSLYVAATRQRQGLGALLLADAVQRAYASADSAGSSMLVVDAISDHAAGFYEANGFVRLPDSLRLVLPMHAIGELMEP
jgi:GNAT superfamily N-acetyltransferase